MKLCLYDRQQDEDCQLDPPEHQYRGEVGQEEQPALPHCSYIAQAGGQQQEDGQAQQHSPTFLGIRMSINMGISINISRSSSMGKIAVTMKSAREMTIRMRIR